jgi:hypothetical protein
MRLQHEKFEFDESRDMSSCAEPSNKHPQARGHQYLQIVGFDDLKNFS